MSEITTEMHGQIQYEQYKIATVDKFVVNCPYCGNEIITESCRNTVCPECNQIISLFPTANDAERYLNHNLERRVSDDEVNKQPNIDKLNMYDGGMTVWIGTDGETLEWLESLGNCDDLDDELQKCFSTTVIDFIHGDNVPGYNNLDNPESFEERFNFMNGLDGFTENEKIITEYLIAEFPNEMKICQAQ